MQACGLGSANLSASTSVLWPRERAPLVIVRWMPGSGARASPRWSDEKSTKNRKSLGTSGSLWGASGGLRGPPGAPETSGNPRKPPKTFDENLSKNRRGLGSAHVLEPTRGHVPRARASAVSYRGSWPAGARTGRHSGGPWPRGRASAVIHEGSWSAEGIYTPPPCLARAILGPRTVYRPSRPRPGGRIHHARAQEGPGQARWWCIDAFCV